METKDVVAGLTALAQTTRLDTFRLLIRHEPEGLPAGEVARLLGIPQNTMSTHLAILARSGLVTSERHSRLIVYRANVASLRSLMLFLAKDCCAGSSELCAPLVAELTSC